MKPTPSLPTAILLAPTDGGLALARSLARRGVEVRMLVEDERSWVGATRWARTHVVGPLPAHADEWIAKLGELGVRGEGVLLSCTDNATELVVRQRAMIPPSLRSFECPSSPHLKLMDKASLYEIAQRIGVRCPRTVVLHDRAQLDRTVSEVTFPCLVKPVHSHRWRLVLGERRAIVVHSPEQLVREVTPALDAHLDVLVSEHIPGPDGHLEGASTVRDSDGVYTLISGRRKVRMHPPGYGAAAIMESAEVPESLAMTKDLLDSTGFIGVSTSEFKLHAGTGERYLIEVNVRVPQGWALADVAGADGSWRLYATLAGLPLGPQPRPRTGVRNVIPSLEIRAVPTNLAERRLSLREVLAGYRGVRGFSGLSWRDPLPVLMLAGDNAKWALGHLRERWRSRAAD